MLFCPNLIHPCYVTQALSQIETAVLHQIEFYMGVSNYPADSYLQSLCDENGWIPLSEILQFRRMRLIGVTDADFVAQLLHEYSPIVFADLVSNKIRSSWLAFHWPAVMQQANQFFAPPENIENANDPLNDEMPQPHYTGPPGFEFQKPFAAVKDVQEEAKEEKCKILSNLRFERRESNDSCVTGSESSEVAHLSA